MIKDKMELIIEWSEIGSFCYVYDNKTKMFVSDGEFMDNVMYETIEQLKESLSFYMSEGFVISYMIKGDKEKEYNYKNLEKSGIEGIELIRESGVINTLIRGEGDLINLNCFELRKENSCLSEEEVRLLSKWLLDVIEYINITKEEVK